MRPARILVIRLRMAGDLILTTPALAALRRAFPDAEIDLLVERRLRELVDENPALTRVIPLDPGAGSIISTLNYMRARSYDFAIDFHSIPKTAWLAFLSGARYRLGYRWPDRGFLYTEAVEPPAAFSEHSVTTSMRLLAPLGIAAHPGRALMRSSGGEADARRLLSERLVPRLGPRGFALVHVAPSNRYKRWPAERCADFARGLAERGFLPALTGGAADAPYADEIARRSGGATVSLAGATSFKSLRELARRAALYVGPDSGPAHVAATTAVPLVVLYGPTAPITFGPFRPGVAHVALDLPCRPCRQKGCAPGDYRCMEIPAAAALGAVDRLLP